MNYSSYSKFLHRMIFKSAFLRKALFNLETDMFASDDPRYDRNKHVFVSGFARSGTTSLMQHFHKTGQFRSLTYNDMPFVLSPNLWRKIYPAGKGNATYEERAHGDGIMVSFDSPEAFEEVFWILWCGNDFNKEKCLVPHAVSSQVIELFRKYIEVVIKSEENQQVTRYLSKNNNNILRIPAIEAAFPNAIILTPFRKPLAHAASLLNQHLRFLKIHQTDKFGQEYMNWLGHHEFGSNHKPFCFSQDAEISSFSTADSRSINYWLERWLNYYQYSLDHYPDKLIFLSFEKLCEAPRQVFEYLGEKADLRFDLKGLTPFIPPVKNTAGVDPELLSRCEKLYDELVAAGPL